MDSLEASRENPRGVSTIRRFNIVKDISNHSILPRISGVTCNNSLGPSLELTRTHVVAHSVFCTIRSSNIAIHLTQINRRSQVKLNIFHRKMIYKFLVQTTIPVDERIRRNHNTESSQTLLSRIRWFYRTPLRSDLSDESKTL